MKRKLTLIIILAIVLFGLSLYRGNSQKVSPQKDLVGYANQILKKCFSATHRQSCYDKDIPALLDNPASLSMEEAFSVTRLVQEKDSSFPYCHVLGHNLSAKEVKKDPSKWKEVLSRCPSGLCSNGCIHGGFQERFRAESFTDQEIEEIKPDLKSICERRSNWNPTGLEQASCYHALGHLTMYLTSADTNKSIKLCEEIAIKEDGRNFTPVCLDGVFMQTYQPLEPEDFALIVGKEVKRSDVDNFCSSFSGLAKASCISESWPLFREEILGDPKELVNFCSKEDQAARSRCFEGMFYVLVAQFNFDEEKIKNYCMKIPNELTGKCFANTASRMIETDYRNISRSVSLCSSVLDVKAQEECFDELVNYSAYNFHRTSVEFLKLCNDLPNPWRGKCLN